VRGNETALSGMQSRHWHVDGESIRDDGTMRVLHAIRSVNPAHGGTVAAVVGLSSWPVQQGHSVEVVSLDDGSEDYIASFPLPLTCIGSARGTYGYTSRLPRWVAANASRFDAVVLHGVWDFGSYGTWLGLRSGRTPYVIYPHGMLDPWFRQGRAIKHAIKQAYWLVAGGPMLKHASAVLFTCEEERRLARGSFFGPSYREKVVAFGAPDMPAGAQEQVPAFRRAVPALGNRRYLLFLSRIHPKKGGDLLLQAFAELAGRYPEIDLVMAGPDDMGLKASFGDYLAERKLSHRIHWPGMLGSELKWGALLDAEAFVLPSHQENFGIAVAEAMACTTPVVISNKVNIWREIADGKGGVIGEDTVDGTVAALTQFLETSAEGRKTMANAARQTYERHFTLEAAGRALMGVLADATNNGRSGATKAVELAP
jgi:glycosyltransferase involved in cell wall biosynthesis